MPKALNIVPDDWGPKAAADDAAVTLTTRGPDSIQFTAPVHLAIVLFTPQPQRETALATDRRLNFSAPVGSFEIIPAGADFFGQWSTPKENILFGVEQRKLIEIAQGEFGTDSFELYPPKAGTVDRKALQIAGLIRDEFRRECDFSKIYIDALVTAMSVHILREYSSLGHSAEDREEGRKRGGLPLKRWREIESYMREHIAEDMPLAVLAALAGVSASHFLRAFRETTGEPPHRYLLNLRVQHAERLALTTDLPLKLVAERSGFSSQSHLTAAMRQLRLTTPGEIREVRMATRRPENAGNP